jgi:transcriptional regulator GlxA family with amidase domain
VTRTVAIMVFDDVEVLDFAGPFEVFGVAGARSGSTPFDVYTVALAPGPVRARNGLSVNPRAIATRSDQPDILVVPGGYGVRREMLNPLMLNYLRHVGAHAELLLSVCTGSLLLARAGLLEGLRATTHRDAMHELESLRGNFEVFPEARIVDNGRVVTSAGISAGIDMSLYIVGRILEESAADETAYYMQYDWRYRRPDGRVVVRQVD